MKKYYCDRCNKEITPEIDRYEINVEVPGRMVFCDNRLFFDDRDPIFDKPFHLCDKCMKDLSKWINSDVYKLETKGEADG